MFLKCNERHLKCHSNYFHQVHCVLSVLYFWPFPHAHTATLTSLIDSGCFLTFSAVACHKGINPQKSRGDRIKARFSPLPLFLPISLPSLPLALAAPAFFEWKGQRGEDILEGQVYMVANNALPQYGTHTPLSKVPLPFS